MTHGRQLERTFVLVDILVLMIAMLASFALRESLATWATAFKPSAPTWDYVRLLLVFIPIWTWCASRGPESGTSSLGTSP